MEKRLAALALATLAACAAPPARPPVNLGVSFDAAAAQQMLLDGVNSIRGSAFLRQQGGGVVTCAGAQVSLVPATAYAKRVYMALYGTDTGQARHLGYAVDVEPKSDDFGRLMKHTQCDAQGTFSFERVADGDYFVETTVKWIVGGVPNGGPIMRRVAVSGGAIASIVVAP